jgi:ABC-type microcin C transport system permease subunit YejE
MRRSRRRAVLSLALGLALVVFAVVSVLLFGDKPYLVVPLGFVGVCAIGWGIRILRQSADGGR